MRKLNLSEWASAAEIVGTAAVVMSLIFVGLSVERNTAAITLQVSDEVYNTVREINLNLLNNPELLSITTKAATEPDNLSETEMEQYKVWLHVYIDLWERTSDWEDSELIQREHMEPWHEYFSEWTKRHLTREIWEDIKWKYPGNSKFRDRIESVLSDLAN